MAPANNAAAARSRASGDAGIDALLRFFRRKERAIVLWLCGAAVFLRALLVAASAPPFGYVWDPYYAGIQVLYRTGRLPRAEDCWACFHPPLFYLLGLPFYALGRALQPGSDDLALRLTGGLALCAAAATIYYGYRLLRLYRCRGATLVWGLSLLVVFPCLFISSYGPEADILLTGFLSAFLYYLARYAARPGAATWADGARIGVLAGAAAATKYSGLVAPLTAAIVMGVEFARRPRPRTMGIAAATLAIAAGVGGWKYIDNARHYGSPLHANGSAAQGFAVGGHREAGAAYEFTTFRLGALGDLFRPLAPAGQLTYFPVYLSVPTTLQALAWSDMTFFSVPGRHGGDDQPYPRKRIPRSLPLAVIVLGLVPEAVAMVGFARSLRHRVTWPIAVFSLVGFGSYVWWFIPQELWALKTKYILFLLPGGVLYSAFGLGWLHARLPAAAIAVAGLVTALVVLCHVYLYAFAVGHL